MWLAWFSQSVRQQLRQHPPGSWPNLRLPDLCMYPMPLLGKQKIICTSAETGPYFPSICLSNWLGRLPLRHLCLHCRQRRWRKVQGLNLENGSRNTHAPRLKPNRRPVDLSQLTVCLKHSDALACWKDGRVPTFAAVSVSPRSWPLVVLFCQLDHQHQLFLLQQQHLHISQEATHPETAALPSLLSITVQQLHTRTAARTLLKWRRSVQQQAHGW